MLIVVVAGLDGVADVVLDVGEVIVNRLALLVCVLTRGVDLLSELLGSLFVIGFDLPVGEDCERMIVR